jgi:hypothetical protein
MPLPIPDRPFSTISPDFVTGLLSSKGQLPLDAILVIVDMFTKYGYFIPCTSTIDTTGTVNLLWHHVVKHMGMPLVIVSDRDPHFLSSFWSSLAHHFDTKLAMSTAAHPQTDGQTEILNQRLETMLHTYVNKDRNDWSDYLDVLMLAYNNSVHSATKEAPVALLMGFKPRLPSSLLIEEGSLSVGAESRIKELNLRREWAREAIREAQKQQIRNHNTHHQEVTFQVGDLVLIDPHRLNLWESKGEGRKLMQKHIGPFEVTEVVNNNAYHLRLPYSYPIHNMVSVSCLKL